MKASETGLKAMRKELEVRTPTILCNLNILEHFCIASNKVLQIILAVSAVGLYNCSKRA